MSLWGETNTYNDYLIKIRIKKGSKKSLDWLLILPPKDTPGILPPINKWTWTSLLAELFLLWLMTPPSYAYDTWCYMIIWGLGFRLFRDDLAFVRVLFLFSFCFFFWFFCFFVFLFCFFFFGWSTLPYLLKRLGRNGRFNLFKILDRRFQIPSILH